MFESVTELIEQVAARRPLVLDADARVTDLRTALTEMAQALGSEITVASGKSSMTASADPSEEALSTTKISLPIGRKR